MKILIVAILIIVMVFGLCACSPATGNDGTTAGTDAAQVSFQVGFGAGNITPDWPCSLQGSGNDATRISKGKLTEIYIHCVAITDTDDETVLIMSIDAGGGGFGKRIFPKLESEFGIPQDHMILSAIHQHSTPSGGSYTGGAQYEELLVEKAKEAVAQALADRAPATMFLNTVETNALSFVRHYIANDEAGTIVTDNYNDDIGKEYGYKGHESESDKEMRLIKFVREGDKKPIIMVNFQAHPHLGGGPNQTNIHGDWPEIMRQTVADELDAHCMYLSGAGGNLNSSSRIAEENITTDFKEHGKRAANYVIKAEKGYVEASFSDIKVASATNTYEVDHSMDHLIDIAKEIDALKATDFNKSKEEVKKYYPDLTSIYHASAIVSKSKLGPTLDLTIGAISIGDVVFTYHPYEMFDTNGMELRSGTVGNENYTAEEQLENPYKMTFICTLANGHLGYVPSLLGYTNGGYATVNSRLASGSGERLVGDYLQILNELQD